MGKRWSKNVDKKGSGVVEWTLFGPRWELRIKVYIMSTFCHAKERKMLHLKEGETKELGEGILMFPSFSNEGEIIFFLRSYLKIQFMAFWNLCSFH